MSHAVLAKYDEKRELYDTFTQKMGSLIREIIAGSGVNIHSVTQRTKDRKSLAKKLAKPNSSYLSLEDITDISGIRITTYFEDDVDRIVEILTKEFAIDIDNSVDKRALLDPDRFGYLSTHHVASLEPGRCVYAEYRRFSELKFEIQTRSILQHAWAEIEHDLGYKSMLEVPKEIRRRFSRLSGLLELADSEFIAIRDQLHQYTERVPKEISDAPQAVEINKDALLAFAQSDRVAQELDKLIANLGGWELEVIPDRTGAHVKALNFVGIATIADLKKNLQSNSNRVAAFAKAWLPKIPRGGIDPKVAIGISFMYLGHVLANDQDKLFDYLGMLGLTGEGRDNIARAIVGAIKNSDNI